MLTARRPSMALSPVRDQFLAAKRRAGKSEKTLAAYDNAINQFIAHAGDLFVTRGAVDAWLDHLERKRVATATRSLYITALRELARYGVAERLWPVDLLASIPRIARPKTLPRPFTHDEQRALMALDLPLDEQALRALLNFAGLRDDEVCAIQLRHFTRPQPMPDGTELPATLHVYGKGRKERVVPLHPACWAIVEAYAVCRPDTSPGAYLFSIRDTGSRWSPAMIRRRVHRWGARARVEACVPHRFRHRFGTELLEADTDLRTVQELMGHASPATTAIYTQVTDPRKRAAVLRLAAHA